MENRAIIFDLNRRIEEENNMANEQELALLMQSIRQQQDEIAQLREQLAHHQQQQQQIIQHQQQIAQQQPNQQNLANGNQMFQLTPEQVLNHFRRLKSFNGKEEFTLMEFIRSVEDAAELCHNEQLLQYAYRIVLNEKIQGEAKRCIQRLGDNLTWPTAKAELKLHFRPRKDYSELINECRNVKVSNLRELFDIIRSVNYQLNELYNFEDENDRPINFSPENNDRYLVGIVMEKMDNLVRGNVEKNYTLIEIYNRFAELKLLDDERAINIAHRKFKNFNKNHNREFNKSSTRQINRQNNTDERHVDRWTNNNNCNSRNNNENYNRNQNFNRNNFNRNTNNNSGNFREYHPNQFNNNRNSGRFYNRNNSGQLRSTNNNFNSNNNVEPMEVENVQKQDTNFSLEPRPPNYP